MPEERWSRRPFALRILQVERSGIEPPAVDPKRVQSILDADKPN
jgi:hypothetical protein